VDIIPAIDLRDGKVVRLEQGDYDRETVFSSDPVAVARQFAEAGATRIHVVDLDGAKDGKLRHVAQVEAVLKAVPIAVELGGGIRTPDTILHALAIGVERVVVGTAAIADPRVIEHAIAFHGAERVVVGLDARDGKVAVAGWTETTEVTAQSLMERMAAAGVERFIYTDIARDGTLSSPNFDAVADMRRHASALRPAGRATGGVRLISSGGIRSLEHLRRLASIGVEGAIVGSAVYRGTLDLAEAIDWAKTARA